jgi:hypothetical protein
LSAITPAVKVAPIMGPRSSSYANSHLELTFRPGIPRKAEPELPKPLLHETTSVIMCFSRAGGYGSAAKQPERPTRA